MSRVEPPDFELRVEIVDGVRVVTLAGEVDLSCRQAIAGALAPAGMPVLVDLAGVTFIDSSGLAALLAASRGAHGRLALVCSPDGSPRRLLELASVEDIFLIYSTRHEALGSLPGG